MRIHPVDGLLFLAMKLLKSMDHRETDLKYFKPENAKNILVVSSTAIGDTLLSTPAIRAVRERYPAAHITAHFNVRNWELFENNPHIDGIIPYHGGYKKFLKTVREFRRQKFDLVLIFHGNEPQATPMAYLSGARFILKFPKSREFSFLLSNNSEQMPDASLHVIKKRLKLAELVGCSSSAKEMVLPEREEGKSFIAQFLKECGMKAENLLIGFQAGASTVGRIWPSNRFIELGRRLVAASSQVRVIITGSPQEYALCREIADGIGERAMVTAGRIPLKYLPSLVKRFRAVITGDTGILHMAVAVGTTVIALFVPSTPKDTGPLYDLHKHVVIHKEMPCNPCNSNKCESPFCMELITVDEVFAAVRKFLP